MDRQTHRQTDDRARLSALAHCEALHKPLTNLNLSTSSSIYRHGAGSYHGDFHKDSMRSWDRSAWPRLERSQVATLMVQPLLGFHAQMGIL